MSPPTSSVTSYLFSLPFHGPDAGSSVFTPQPLLGQSRRKSAPPQARSRSNGETQARQPYAGTMPGTAYGRPASQLRTLGARFAFEASVAGPTSQDETASSSDGAAPANASSFPPVDSDGRVPEAGLPPAHLTPADGNGEDAGTAAPGSPDGKTEDGAVAPATDAEKGAQDEEEKDPTHPKGADGESLSNEEMQELRRLEQRDAEVRTHEQSHRAAGQGYVRGGIAYEYQTGPDGKRYAVGGEVQIDISAESTPEKTIAKMQVVRAAALAPAQPSSQDRRAAATARLKEGQARRALVEAKAEKVEESREETRTKAEENRESRKRESEVQQDRQAGQAASPLEAVVSEATEDAASDSPGAVAQGARENRLGPGAADEPPSSPLAVGAFGKDGEPSSASQQAVEAARRAFAVQAYTRDNRPELARPDTRTMQPGRPRPAGLGMVPTVKPPAGSPADINLLSVNG